MRKEKALLEKYIALNNDYYWKCITIDIDRVYNGDDFYERIYVAGIPPPNYIVISPETKHFHLIYLLPCPVYRNGRKAEFVYGKVRETLTNAWRGDRGYNNHLMKNPLHPHWITAQIRQDGYSLEELIHWSEKQEFEKGPSLYSEDPLGRNCTLFALTRQYAISLYRRGELSEDALYDFAKNRNDCGYSDTTIKDPLPNGEVRSIVKSVYKFMQCKYTGEGGGYYTEEDRKKALETRQTQMWNKIHRFIEYKKMKLPLKRIAGILKLSLKTLYRYIKLLSDLTANIALPNAPSDTKVNGVSRAGYTNTEILLDTS
jgi:hypothetical protein